MPDEPILREQAREAIKNGKLPAHAPTRTWGGPGVDAPCQICGKPATKTELEFQLEFQRNGGAYT
jgi:hypothetical protein